MYATDPYKPQRSALPGECRASECSLLCDDFHRLGFSRMMIDPVVVTAYKHHHAQVGILDTSMVLP